MNRTDLQSIRVDYQSLLGEEIFAGRELVRELDKRFPVKAAFWLKAGCDESRYLYIASEQITNANLKDYYRLLIEVATALPPPNLDPFCVKLVPADDAWASAAIDMERRLRRLSPLRLQGTRFAGELIDDAYIYHLHDSPTAN